MTNLDGVIHINCTKIPSLSDISDSIDQIKKWVRQGWLSAPKIDNITATIKVGHNLNLTQLYKTLKQSHQVRYAAQKFPAVFLTLQFGTALIFASGKIISVGCKSETEVHQSVTQCSVIMSKYLTGKV